MIIKMNFYKICMKKSKKDLIRNNIVLHVMEILEVIRSKWSAIK